MLMMAFVFYALATIVRVWIATSERIKPARTPEKPTWNGLTSQLKSMFGMLFAGGLLTWIWISDAIGDTSYMLTRELFPIYLSDIGNLTVTQIGLLGSAWGIASIVGSFSGGYLTDKRSERTILTGGLIMIAIGVYFLVTKNQQSRNYWAIGLILWGINAIVTGTSYQTFGYELKCCGLECCLFTSNFKLASMLLTTYCINFLVAATGYTSTRVIGRKRLIKFAIIGSTVNSVYMFVGAVIPVKFLISYEGFMAFIEEKLKR
jgi:predicted MFS family arabinose efflux permease